MHKLVPLTNRISNQGYGTYLRARQMAKSKGGLPRMSFCSKNVLEDYCASGGTFPFWLGDVVAHCSRSWRKGASHMMNDLEDYSIGWKVPLSYLKDPSIILGDAFAPDAVLVIAPGEFEVTRKTVVVHPQRIIVCIADFGARMTTIAFCGKGTASGIHIIGSVVPCVRPAMMEHNGHVSLPSKRFSGSRIAHVQHV